MGGAPKAAIKLGEGNKDEANKILGNSITMTLIFAVILTIIVMIFKDLIKHKSYFEYSSILTPLIVINTLYIFFFYEYNGNIKKNGTIKITANSRASRGNRTKFV